MLLQKVNCFTRTTLHYKNLHYENPRVYAEQKTEDQHLPYTVKTITKPQRAQSYEIKKSRELESLFSKNYFI